MQFEPHPSRPPERVTPYAVQCAHCNSEAKLTHGEIVHPDRPDYHESWFWACLPCGAWVGCHEGTTRALGRPGNFQLRRLRQRLHVVFDPLWRAHNFRGCFRSRSAAYNWLADQLVIRRGDCHIGSFDIETCCRAIAAVEAYRAEIAP